MPLGSHLFLVLLEYEGEIGLLQALALLGDPFLSIGFKILGVILRSQQRLAAARRRQSVGAALKKKKGLRQKNRCWLLRFRMIKDKWPPPTSFAMLTTAFMPDVLRVFPIYVFTRQSVPSFHWAICVLK